jgi:hypothetical protein
MLLGQKIAYIAAFFDNRKLFCWLAILSLFLLYVVIAKHREFMTTMDVLTSATTAGVSFLASQPQNPTGASSSSYLESALSGLTSLPSATIANTSLDYDSGYDWQRSTEENYRSSQISGDGFVGDYKEFRQRLDRSYHNDYVPARQALQDNIIRSLLTTNQKDTEISNIPARSRVDKHCEDPSPDHSNEKNCLQDEKGKSQERQNQHPLDTTPWIVFTAGVYGAGKSHTIEKLQSLDCFPPKSSFVAVDPDEIRRMLPEFSLYRPDLAGALTQKEAGMVAELLTDVALSSGNNVVVDGSLRDAAWHEGYFRSLRSRFGSGHAKQDDENGETTKSLRIGILYVTAPIDEIYKRVEQRGASTGRSVPPEFLERSMREVPEAIERLRPLADFFLHVHNSQQAKEEKAKGKELEQDSEDEGSISSLVHSVEEKVSRLSTPPSERQEHVLKSEIEATIFQKKCQSIVGY